MQRGVERVITETNSCLQWKAAFVSGRRMRKHQTCSYLCTLWAIVNIGRRIQINPFFWDAPLVFGQPDAISTAAESFQTSWWLVDRFMSLL